MHPIAYWFTVSVSAWYIGWYLLYVLLGAWLGYISINNGISFNHVYFKTKKVKVYANSVRFRLWGNSKRVIVQGLRVEILPKKSKSSKPKHVPEKDCRFSPDPISIFPKRLKWFFRFLLWHLPTIDLEFKSSELVVSQSLVDLETINLTLKKQRVTNRKDYLNLIFVVAGRNVVSSPKLASSAVPPLSISTFNALAKTNVDTSTGILSGTIMQVYLDDLEIGAFQILRHLFQEDRSGAQKPPKEEPESTETHLQETVDKLSRVYQRVVSTLEEVSLNIGNSRVLGIPCIPSSSTCDLDEYFSHVEPSLSFSVSVKSMALQASHLTDKAAGFMALFNNKKDRPIHLTASVVLLQTFFVSRRFDEATKLQHSDVDEFLNIPNLSFSLKTNVLDHLAKGFGFRDCTMEIYSSVSNPVLDLSVKQIALLSYNRILARKTMILRKLRKRQREGGHSRRESQSEEMDHESSSTSTESSPETPVAHQFDGPYKTSEAPPKTLLDKAVSLLNEYYPRIGVKCAIEQPQYVVRLDGEQVKIIDISYSLMYFHLLTSAKNDYNAKCHVLHPCLKFSRKVDVPQGDENPRVSEEVVGCDNAELQLHILKNLRLKVSGTAEGAFINLGKPDVLNGINEIVTSSTTYTFKNLSEGSVNQFLNNRLLEEFGEKPGKQTHHHRHIKTSSLDKFYRNLPSWFVSAEVELKSLKATLGCTSPLLPPELIAELSKKSEFFMTDTEQIIELTIKHHFVSLYNENVLDRSLSDTSSSDSLETLALDNQDHLYWKMLAGLKKISLFARNKNKRSSPLLALDEIEASLAAVKSANGNEVNSKLSIGEICGTVDKEKVYAILGSIHLILQTIVLPVKKVKAEVKKDLENFERLERRGSVVEEALLINFQAQVGKINYVARLSDELSLRLQVFDVKAKNREKTVDIDVFFVRLLTDSPFFQNLWCRLGCIDTVKVRLNDPEEEEKIAISTANVRFFQPNGFVVYKLFDNISVFQKIIKHLVKCLNSDEKSLEVYPTESKPLNIPRIRLKSENLSYLMEDDPFEADLGVYFQLGLIEQRKRMDMLSAFEEKVKRSKIPEDMFDTHLYQMRQAISDLWIRKVKAYSVKFANEMDDHKRYIVGNELDLTAADNKKIVGYMLAPPLLKIIMADLDILVTSPKFPLSDLAQYVHDMGQGVPTDTKYNLSIPTHIDMSVNELRMHLRDYPLPLLHLPRAKDAEGRGRALLMKGHLVICETLNLDEEHLRQIPIQLSKPTKGSDKEIQKYDNLTINKSLTTVKLYTDMDVRFDSNGPCRFVWGQAYQFGIQQIMLNFDSFSKPPVDTSDKLGFWDKMRMILHGKFSVRAEGDTQLEVALKGGRDPYDLFPASAGFILSFQDEVIWRVNHEDDSRKFFDISAQTVSWYIPNYLAAPLMTWSRDSSESIFLPDYHNMTNTMHAYYLIDAPTHPVSEKAKHPDINIEEKMAISLSGGIRFIVGFVLQRQSSKDGTTEKGVPHYEIIPMNPEFTSDDHDTYKGFRSTKLHMSLSLEAHFDESYNTIHLSPGAFDNFFKWWSMFQGNMMLPVRKGIVFGEQKPSPKFSQHLMTNTFSFQIKNLFISHIYREDFYNDDDDHIECFGLRARVKDFVVNLHQQKEERISLHKPSGKEIKTQKMIMNLGEVSLSEIDMRLMRATIFRDKYHSQEKPTSKKCKFDIFDNNKQWFDPRDFHEAFKSNKNEVFSSVEVIPMAYSDRFAYIRDTNDVTKDDELRSERQSYGEELARKHTHGPQKKALKRRISDLKEKQSNDDEDIERRISFLEENIENNDLLNKWGGKSNAEKEEHFHNSFHVSSMLFKWNVKVRDIFVRYLHFAQMKSKTRKFLSFEFVSMLENLIYEQDGQADRMSMASSSIHDAISRSRKLSQTLMNIGSSQERIDNFDEVLRETDSDHRVNEDYKIEVVGVQIQFHIEQVVDTVSIISAPLLELKIISVIPKSDNPLVINTTVPEKRYGVLLHDASVTVLEKKDVKQGLNILNAKPWGSTSNWPPWLGIETCKDSSLIDKSFMPIERMSVMFTYDQINSLANDKDRPDHAADNASKQGTILDEPSSSNNKLRLDIPKVTITSTSKQYLAIYATALNLAHYSDPVGDRMEEKLLKLKFQSEFEDYRQMHDRLTRLHSYMTTLNLLLRGYGYRHEYLDNEELNLFLFLNSELENISFETLFTVEALFMRDAFSGLSKLTVADWIIGTDEITLHMLQDDRKPILDLRIEGGTCKRVLMEDGTNDNRIQIRNIKGNNLVKGASYQRFVESVYPPDDEDLIVVDWSMAKPVGGIRIIENFDIYSRPLKIKIDEVTGRQLMQFLFQTDETNEIENSTLIKMNDEMKQKGNNGEADEDDDENEEIEENNNLKVPRGKNRKEGNIPDSDDISEQASLTSTTAISNREVNVGRSRSQSKGNRMLTSVKESSFYSGDENDFEEDVAKMKERSKTYFSITNMTFRPFEVMISLRLKSGFKKMLNVTDFTLELPGFHIEKELISMIDLVELMKSMLLKSLFSHSGTLLKNMMKTRRYNRKQISKKASKEYTRERAKVSSDH